MSGGLFALLDDIAVLAKMTAATVDDVAAGAMKASAKSAGLIVDDAAVTPKYLTGMSPKRELPVIWKIAKGSFRNKLLIVLPVILLLSWLAPFLLPYILILGGLYLSFEGAEKVYEWVTKKHHETAQEKDENKVVSSTIRTDLVLSFEIMLISLTAVDTDNWIVKTGILVAVALLMTVLVYGAVAVLIKIDDVGVWLAKPDKHKSLRVTGVKLVKSMPAVFRVITVIGTLAMLWVGGHILIVSLNDTGVNVFYELLHEMTSLVERAGGFIVWLVDAGISGVFGLIVGLVLIPAVMLLKKIHAKQKH